MLNCWALRPAACVTMARPFRDSKNMSDPTDFIDPNARPPGPESLRPDATIVEGRTHNGKPCRIVDNTATVPEGELRAVLETLIHERKFGPGGLSASGGSTIRLGAPIATHVQFGEHLYRLLLYPYEARIEHF